MIILDTTGKSLEIVLAGAITTNQLPFVCSWVDITSSTFLPGSNDGTTNSATAVIVAAAPSSGVVRQLKFLSVNNKDTAPATVTVQLNNSSTERTVFKTILQPNYTLLYNHDKGFEVYDQNGMQQAGGSGAIGSYYQTVDTAGTPMTERPILNLLAVFSVADNSGNNSTDVNIATGGITYGMLAGSIPATKLVGTDITLTESQITNLTTDLAAKVALAGGTMTGALILNADPIAALGAATKQYVDNSIHGLQAKNTARAATTTALATNTYNNGSSGVGATLTCNSNGALPTIDGVTLSVNDYLLVKNESSTANNGLYQVTQVGDGSHPYILTRAITMNIATEFNGSIIPVDPEGATNGSSWWLMNYVASFIVGTSAVTFSEISAAISYTGGTGISISGTVISLTTTYYSTIQSNGSSATQRAKLNFSTDFTVADDSGNASTDISPGSSIQTAITAGYLYLTNN